ncbi:MAG: hypothetical protein D6714_05305 [Bacteroidetes bacterium]|nr:MAG: hypothetical protein D6714_05305 [Bacteroidota bacterium]
MKKSNIQLVIALLLLCTAPVFAQNQVFDKGNFNLSIGYGVVPVYLMDKATTEVPPLSARLGYGVTKTFNISLYAGFASATSRPNLYGDGILTQYENKSLMAGLRGELRAPRSDRFDIYGGFMLGYTHPFVREVSVEDGSLIERPEGTPRRFRKPEGKVLFSGFVGGTWYINRRFGIFAEAGYGISLLNAGLSVKL